MKRSQYTFLVLLIGGMSALNPVAIDSFLPAIPDIAKELAVDPGTIGITIGIYTLGNAFLKSMNRQYVGRCNSR